MSLCGRKDASLHKPSIEFYAQREEIGATPFADLLEKSVEKYLSLAKQRLLLPLLAQATADSSSSSCSI